MAAVIKRFESLRHSVIAIEDEFYRVIGDTCSAGVVVSRTDDPVEFAPDLSNRVANLVPTPDITRVPRWVSEATQTVGVFPESLRERLRRRRYR